MTVFIDNNATTMVDPHVLDEIIPFLKEQYFNPSSLYREGERTAEKLKEFRSASASFIGAKPNEVFFTGSATESNNLAIKGALANASGRKHIITTSVEHPSVLQLCKDLERKGFDVTYLKVDEDGNLDYVDLIDAIRPDTAVVSIMSANNETGVIFPIHKLSQIVKKTDPMILFHTDATQTIGKQSFNIERDCPYVDLLSFSGHKIYAPKGIGVLYKKDLSSIRPIIIGGHQENGLRAGTENIAYIAGLAKALELIDSKFKDTNPFAEDSIEKQLRDRLERFALNNIKGIKINGVKAKRVDGTTSISFLGVEGESILYALSEKGICVSTGSACSSGTLESSHVLKAMKLPFEYSHGTIRFSFGRFNTEEDIVKLEECLPQIIYNLRRLSPFWDNETDEFRNEYK